MQAPAPVSVTPARSYALGVDAGYRCWFRTDIEPGATVTAGHTFRNDKTLHVPLAPRIDRVVRDQATTSFSVLIGMGVAGH